MTLLLIIAAVVAGVLLYLSSLKGQYEVRRSRWLNAPPEVVFEKLRDFSSWSEWSPWLMHEPDTELTFSDTLREEGGFYTWSGKYVGAGKITHTRFDAPYAIDEALEITKPFKSTSQVRFELEAKDNGTELTWMMRSKMPFLFRFMTEMVAASIAKDYDIGLARLAGVIDPNAEHPEISFDGEVSFPARPYCCFHFEGGAEAMKASMQEQYPKLGEFIAANGLTGEGFPIAAYHKSDLNNMRFDCDIAVPVNGNHFDSDIYQQKMLGDDGRYFRVIQKGSYDFLPLTWYAAASHLKMTKRKFDTSRTCFEQYQTDPNRVTHSNEIVTVLYLPIR